MKLNIPNMGFGTYRLKEEQCFKIVSVAIEYGYRLIDTAQIYGNEKEIGKAIYSSLIPRKDIFITSKLWFPYNNVKESILRSCEALRTEYIDLYLIHKPNNISPQEHLKAFEELQICREAGLVRSIGVTSFSLAQLNELIEKTGIIPDLVQEECHPFLQQKHLQEKIEEIGSIFQAWYPLGSGDKRLFNHPILKEISYKYEINVPTLIIMWHLQEGHRIVVGSSNVEHIKNNINVQTLPLSEVEIKKIRALDCGKSYVSFPNWVQTLFFKSPFSRLV